MNAATTLLVLLGFQLPNGVFVSPIGGDAFVSTISGDYFVSPVP